MPPDSDIARPRRRSCVATFYNGDCPSCRAEIEHYRRLARASGARLLWRSVADHPDALRCFGVDAEAARRGLHVVDRTGALKAGADASIAIWRELPGYRWLAALISLPLLHGLAGPLRRRLLVPALARRQARRAQRPSAMRR